MKACDTFILRNLMGEYLLMPTGEAIRTFHSAVAMNELSAFVWQQLREPVSRDELLTRILDEYDIDEKTAASDLDSMLKEMKQMGIIEG